MFRMTREQAHSLDRIARTNFYLRLASYLRETMPEETDQYDDNALIKYVAASEARAAAHGIDTESGIAQWTCLTLVQGLDFDEDPTVREYFNAPGMTPEEKLEVLVNGLNEALLDSSEAPS